jgi:hypothetical protein
MKTFRSSQWEISGIQFSLYSTSYGYICVTYYERYNLVRETCCVIRRNRYHFQNSLRLRSSHLRFLIHSPSSLIWCVLHLSHVFLWWLGYVYIYMYMSNVFFCGSLFLFVSHSLEDNRCCCIFIIFVNLSFWRV